MANVEINSLAELTRSIEKAWSDLESFLSNVTKDETNLSDEQGWTLADHVYHIAVWEDSVAMLFEGKPRHEALGIDEAFYRSASFDEVNERIRQSLGEVSLQEATEQLVAVHRKLVDHLADLGERDSLDEVRSTFSAAPNKDRRRVIDFIYANTANHYSEHLEWMRTLIGRAA